MNTDTSYRQALSHYQRGDLASALRTITQALNAHPTHFDALLLLGAIHMQQGAHTEAQAAFLRAIGVNPNSYIPHFNLATSMASTGDDDSASKHYAQAARLAPNDLNVWINYGIHLQKIARFDEAINCYQTALRIQPNQAQALANLGATQAALHQYQAALNSFEQALSQQPNMAPAWFNKANTLCKLHRHIEALACYDKASQLAPQHADIYVQKGHAFLALNQQTQALEQYERALQYQPNNVYALHNKANTLNELKRPLDALADYEKIHAHHANYTQHMGDWVCTQTAICHWEKIEEKLEIIAKLLRQGKRIAAPFDVLSLFDDPALQHQAASIYAENFSVPQSTWPQRAANEKIRLGYFSKDFQNHATAYLSAELFELHDREKFEVIAFSFGPPSTDDMRQRLTLAFDQFVDVREKTDEDIAQLARDMGIDIAIDMQGYQTAHRTGIFAYRAAPIQVNYLAYPGSMGASFMDYLIADRTLIPEENQTHFTEKLVYLPNSYQINDRQRHIAQTSLTREEAGLPQDAFVFCCFNNHYKILPTTFNSWMRILDTVENSVLWLLEGDELIMKNLRKAAHSRGIREGRLIFAPKVPLADHLARHQLADLFLDTLPYNAHTTASDALWAGLPVLTQQGASFTSRVAASLLNAVDLPEFITHTALEFETRTIELANQPEKLRKIKEKLKQGRNTSALFDTPKYVRHLESAYEAMRKQHENNGIPTHIFVEN